MFSRWYGKYVVGKMVPVFTASVSQCPRNASFLLVCCGSNNVSIPFVARHQRFAKDLITSYNVVVSFVDAQPTLWRRKRRCGFYTTFFLYSTPTLFPAVKSSLNVPGTIIEGTEEEVQQRFQEFTLQSIHQSINRSFYDSLVRPLNWRHALTLPLIHRPHRHAPCTPLHIVPYTPLPRQTMLHPLFIVAFFEIFARVRTPRFCPCQRRFARLHRVGE
jgi:hypothetical protein